MPLTQWPHACFRIREQQRCVSTFFRVLAIGLPALLFSACDFGQETKVLSSTRSPNLVSIATLAVPEEVTREATAPNSETQHPLPLFSSWSQGNVWYYQNSGQFVPSADAAGFTPDWAMEKLRQGHHVLPFMAIPTPGMEINGPSNCTPCWNSYYQTAVLQAANLKLPLHFVGTQWEGYLSYDSAYYGLPPDQNPNVIGLDGVVHTTTDEWNRASATLSPFGPLGPWYEVGKKWGSSAMMNRLETLYPDPPLVIFLSNNESARLQWVNVETDKRYVDLYGVGRDDDFKRQIVADGWIARYRELQRDSETGCQTPIGKANQNSSLTTLLARTILAAGVGGRITHCIFQTAWTRIL